MADVVILEQNDTLTPSQVVAQAYGEVDRIDKVVVIKMDKDGCVHFSWSNMKCSELAFMAMAFHARASQEIYK
jgi:hypothetical protein